MPKTEMAGRKKENLQENTKRFQHCDAVATKIKCTIDREGNRDGERDRQAEPFGILIYPFTDFSSHFVCKMRQSNYSTTTSMAKKRKNLQWGATTMEATKVKPHAFIHSVYSFSCSSFLSLQHSAWNDNCRLHREKYLNNSNQRISKKYYWKYSFWANTTTFINISSGLKPNVIKENTFVDLYFSRFTVNNRCCGTLEDFARMLVLLPLLLLLLLLFRCRERRKEQRKQRKQRKAKQTQVAGNNNKSSSNSKTITNCNINFWPLAF